MRATLLILSSLVYLVASTPCSSQSSAPYELIHEIDSTTELTGSITLKCRDSSTAEELEISEINFFLNHSSTATNYLSLRERGDITLVEVGSTGIKFNLTREYDGYYICGRRGDDVCTANNTSQPKALICEWI